MCGIIYVASKKGKNISELALTTFIRQEDRGSDSYGLVGSFNGKIKSFKSLDLSEFVDFIEKNSFDNIIIHNRFATSNDKILNSSHPFEYKIDDKVYYFAHNGVVYNHFEIMAKYPDYVWQSIDKNNKVNDSEVLGLDIVKNLELKKTDCSGSIAFLCWDYKNKRVYFSTNGQSPLTSYENDSFLIVSSEGFDNVVTNKLFYYDIDKGKIGVAGGYKTAQYSTQLFGFNDRVYWGNGIYDYKDYAVYELIAMIREEIRYSTNKKETAKNIWEYCLEYGYSFDELRKFGYTLPKDYLAELENISNNYNNNLLIKE